MTQLDKVSGGLVMLLALWGYYIVSGYPASARPYVLVILTGLFFSGLLLLVNSIRKGRRFNTAEITAQFKNIEWNRIGLCVLFSIIYVFALRPVGYIVMSILFMLSLMPVLGVRKPVMVVVVTLCVTFGLYFVFEKLLGVPLPAGILRGIL